MADNEKREMVEKVLGIYEGAKTTVKNISEIITKRVQGDFSHKRATEVLSMVLQACAFMRMSQKEDNSDNDYVILEYLAKDFDLLAFMNEQMRREEPEWEDMSWTDVFVLDIDTKSKFAEIIASMVSSETEQTIGLFAKADELITYMDYKKALCEKAKMFIVGASTIDDDDLQDEDVQKWTSMALYAFEILVEEKWK